jgi:hypothetical protein
VRRSSRWRSWSSATSFARHTAAGIELRIVPDLMAVWQRVIASTLEFSGLRLRNLC